MTMPSADRPPRPLVCRAGAGTLPGGRLRRAVGRFHAGWRRCLRWLGVRLTRRRPPSGDEPGRYDRVFADALAAGDRLAREVAAERAAAASFVARLVELPAGQRRLLIANSGACTRSVCELLIDKARSLRHTSAHDTLAWAELARQAAERQAGRYGLELAGRAWAEVGNAYRILGDLAEAGRALAKAERLLADAGADPLAEADLASLQASLAHDRRDLAGAIRLLERAAALYEEVGEGAGLARTLLKLASVHDRSGVPERGISIARRALALTDGLDDSALRRTATHNLIYLVAESGQPLAAAALLARARPLFGPAAGRLDRWRFEWLAARIDRDLGLAERAARRLTVLRRRYLREELPDEVALVSLDLAAAHFASGRRDELARLAAESTSLFRSLGIAREALASVALLADLTARDAADVLREAAAAVEDARRRASATPRRGPWSA